MEEKYIIDKIAFSGPNGGDRGYTTRASYLKEPIGQALIEIFKDGNVIRSFLFPAYKIYNIQAHFKNIVDGEIENSTCGYKMASWNGIYSAVVASPVKTKLDP